MVPATISNDSYLPVPNFTALPILGP